MPLVSRLWQSSAQTAKGVILLTLTQPKSILRSPAWKEQGMKDYLLRFGVGGGGRSCMSCMSFAYDRLPRPWMHVGLSRWIEED